MQVNKRIGYLGGEEGDDWWVKGVTLTGKGTTREHLDSGMREGLQPLAMPPCDAPRVTKFSILPQATPVTYLRFRLELHLTTKCQLASIPRKINKKWMKN